MKNRQNLESVEPMNPNNKQTYNDVTVRIQDAYGNLLMQKPLSKITVKDICEEAEIHRTTFYAHFTDMQDLREKQLQFVMDKFYKIPSCDSGFDFKKAIQRQLEFLYAYRRLIVQQLDIDPTNNILSGITPTAYPDVTSGHTSTSFYASTFINAGYYSVILQWIKHDCDEPINNIVDMLYSFIADKCNFFESLAP